MATTQAIGVSEKIQFRLEQLSDEQARPIGGLLDEFDPRICFTGLTENFRRLRDSAVEAAGHDDEVGLWDATLNEGLAVDFGTNQFGGGDSECYCRCRRPALSTVTSRSERGRG